MIKTKKKVLIVEDDQNFGTILRDFLEIKGFEVILTRNGIEGLKKSLKGTDVEDIKKKTQNLIQVSMKLGEAVYKSQKKPDDNDKGTGGPKDKNPNEKDNVVDADFEDVKEDKEKSA